MVLAALEGRTPKDAWRTATSRFNPVPGAAEYLRFLSANGYALSEIERVVTGDRRRRPRRPRRWTAVSGGARRVAPAGTLPDAELHRSRIQRIPVDHSAMTIRVPR
jgi:hypothetical protein